VPFRSWPLNRITQNRMMSENMPQSSSEARERIAAAAESYLRDHIARGRFPSASYVVGTSAEILAQGAFGHAVVEPERIEAQADTIYDLASVTKPLVTTTMALLLAQRGELVLEEPVSTVLPELPDDKRKITYIDLLAHRSGLPAWWAFFGFGRTEESYLQTVSALPLEYPTGKGAVYSDCGFILLYLALQRVTGGTLRELVKQWLFQPLGLTDSMFSPPPELKRRIAATDRGTPVERELAAARKIDCAFRDELIWGTVNDGNSWGLGGFAGNAGLFATASDAWELTRVYTSSSELLTRSTRELALRNYTPGLAENRALGWQLPSASDSHPSGPLSADSFGHTGFTGSSVWVDPQRDLIFVLLTNRVHPRIVEHQMQMVRRRFHEVVVKAFER
jgi:CubicO group peptidase (beta-lactamase class C family)